MKKYIYWTSQRKNGCVVARVPAAKASFRPTMWKL